jgi:hypothetical protein
MEASSSDSAGARASSIRRVLGVEAKGGERRAMRRTRGRLGTGEDAGTATNEGSGARAWVSCIAGIQAPVSARTKQILGIA